MYNKMECVYIPWGEWCVDEMADLVSGGTQLGYTPSGMESGFELSTLFPDYSMAGMPEWTGYILSAVVGVALLVIFFKIVSSLMKDKVDFKKKALFLCIIIEQKKQGFHHGCVRKRTTRLLETKRLFLLKVQNLFCLCFLN